MSFISNSDLIALSLGSFFLVGALTPLMRTLAIRIGFMDAPNSSHKSHTAPVPYLGGISIIIGILIIVYSSLLLRGTSFEISLVSSLLAPAVFLGIVGFIDDKVSLRPLPRFIAQTIAGIIAAGVMVRNDSFGNPTGKVVLDVFITILWIVGITNSINFFDNVDGGASGAVAVISVGIFLISQANGQVYIAAISVVLFGSVTGFLIWNKAPARIYMGDAGALFLGSLVAMLSIRIDPAVNSLMLSLSVPLLLLAVPILDTSVAVISRIRRRLSPFVGGRDHLSHRLMRLGLLKTRAVYTLWLISGVFVFFAVLIAVSVIKTEIMPVFLFSLWLIALSFFLRTADSEVIK